jgi:MFS family permease
VGDVFIAAGLGLFVFVTMLQGSAVDTDRVAASLGIGPGGVLTARPGTTDALRAVGAMRAEGYVDSAGGAGARLGGLRLRRPIASTLSGTAIHPETGLAAPSAFVDTLELDRPVMLGGTSPGPTGPAAQLPLAQALQPEAVAVPPIVARIGGHPYVRLALDARFSAFWLGQTISLFGDRLHQVALGVLVYGLSGSPLLTGLAFLAATLPNLVLGPIAGTLVDRWDHKQVLIVSDLMRAALVLLLPIVATQDIRLIYPIVFAITTVSIFFRPAKAAVLPRLVRREDFMAASSATWTGEALADVMGYPLAGLFIGFLGAALPLAFFVDAASYLISALLILGLSIPPVVQRAAPVVGGAVRRFATELRDGWRFMRGEPTLFQNTLISALAQASIGATLALTVVYAREALDTRLIPYPQNYSALEAVLGLGNLVGGLAIGLVGSRFGRGRLIATGFVAMGLATIVLGLTSNVLLALVAVGIAGVANLVFIIPTQALFAERTPASLMGRVVSFRQTLVFGSLTGAMALSGLLAELLPVGLVIALFGGLTVVGGVLAILLPAVRDS